MRDFMVINYRQVYEVAFIGVWSGYFVISSGELSGLMERLGDNVISRKSCMEILRKMQFHFRMDDLQR